MNGVKLKLHHLFTRGLTRPVGERGRAEGGGCGMGENAIYDGDKVDILKHDISINQERSRKK